MSQTDLQQYKISVKNFQQRVINRSIGFLLFLDKASDKVLECCQANILPGTLSMLSFLPLAALVVFHPGVNTIGFILTALSLFIHQIMDIANKKQAYRLHQFSLSTFYVDHIYDSLSCGVIVYLITTLLEYSAVEKWLCIFIFGFLPFYLAHVSMYYSAYMEFQIITPQIQGLLFFELFFIGSAFKNDLLHLELAQGISICSILMGASILWLLFFIGKSVWDIRQNNKQIDEISLKNLFVILALGYIFFENTIISAQFLESSLYFSSIFILNITHFSLIIGNLLLAYGSSTKFNQMSINTLLVTSGIVLIYSICFLAPFSENQEKIIATASIITLAVLECIYFIWQHRKNLNLIIQALN